MNDQNKPRKEAVRVEGNKSRIHSTKRSRWALKRLPRNYSWRLLRSLLDSCSGELSASTYAHLSASFRREQPAEYYGLDTQYGIQCIAGWANPMQGNPAVIHMLVSAFRKCGNLELYSAKERRERCLTNVRLVDAALPSMRAEWRSDDVYARAREWLASLLGAAPDLETVGNCSRHGPGSTASIDFDQRSQYFKYLRWPYRSTPSARGQLVDCIKMDARWASTLEDSLRCQLDIPMWSILDQQKVWNLLVDGGHPYNNVTTVPKDGRKDRPIAKEQTGNIYLQLGVGAIIRSRLRGVGVDLNTQAEINRKLALESSRTKEFFTIDLSNASDTIGYDLVQALLPNSWFKLLDSLRAPWGVLPTGEAFLYRKFSSMGNGFTFELETIIFMALCHGVSRVYGDRSDRFAVFGDDIIGPDYLYTQCRIYLEYSGFQVNSEKSFHGSARVRESCGVDGLDGYNIRPFFVKQAPDTVLDGIGLRNRIRAWFYRHLGGYPASLDTLLIGDVFEDMPPIGPDSDVEFDGWLQDGPRSVGTHYHGLVPTSVQLPSRELGFRKLMHSLRDCSGEGGNFLVSEVSERVKRVDRVVFSRFDWLVDH